MPRELQEKPTFRREDVNRVERYIPDGLVPTVSIVTANLNGREVLRDFVDSVAASTFRDYELVMVDNGSTDGGLEGIEKETLARLNSTVIYLNRNLGFAEANNVGVSYSRGEVVVFLNNDTTIEPDCLEKLIEPLKDGAVGSVQAKLLSGDGTRIDGGGDFVDLFGVPFVFARGLSSAGRLTKTREIFSARAAAMAMRSELFVKAGGFDSFFFAGYEDVDLGWRLRLLGYKAVFVPAAVVYHIGGFTLGRRRRQQGLANRNLIVLIAKNIRPSMLIPSVFVSWGQYYGSLLSLPESGMRGSYLRAIMEPFALTKYAIKRRMRSNGKRDGSNVYRGDLIYRGSVTIDYIAARMLMLLGRKTEDEAYEPWSSALRSISLRFKGEPD